MNIYVLFAENVLDASSWTVLIDRCRHSMMCVCTDAQVHTSALALTLKRTRASLELKEEHLKNGSHPCSHSC